MKVRSANKTKTKIIIKSLHIYYLPIE